jgi:transcriptional regulator
MFRKDLIPLLQERAMTIKEISRLVGQKEVDTLSDLEHLIRSLKHGDQKLAIDPAVCRKCGFEFGPEKLNKPSRCPKCKSNFVSEPRLQILAR